MDTLPDFSSSKVVVKAKIEAALKERKKGVNNMTLFLCMFFMSIGFTIIYLNDIFKINSGYNRALLTNNMDSDFVIELPNSFSVSTPGDITLIKKSELIKVNND